MNGLGYNDFVLVIGAGGNSSDVSYRVHRLLFTHHCPARYFGMNMPKFHCRRQSGMNFGYVTVNGVNSNYFVPTPLYQSEFLFTL